jgi:arylsulfatase A-like enzyme
MRLSRAAAIVTAAGLISAGLLAARSASPTSGSSNAPPLIVLITIDALRADRLGVYGYDRPTSPHIDRLARESVVIGDAIAHAPYTKASVASLMTGLYPTAHKTFTVSASFADAMDGHVGRTLPTTDVLPASVTTLAEALKERGYATAAITSNPFLIADFGFAQGFDRFEFLGGGEVAVADAVLTRALDTVATATGPLFLWVHLMEPHSPYAPPEEHRRELPPVGPVRPIPADVQVPDYLAEQRSNDARVYESLYEAEIRSADAALGCFFDALRDRPAWRSTVVVITSDHGEQFLDHGGLEHNTNLYDELIRVPLIIRAPDATPRYVDAQAQLVDVLPTIVGLAGGRPINGINGQDLQPLLRGESLPPEPAYAELVGHQRAVRTREWKLIVGPGDNRELYALTRDPGEQFTVDHPKQMAAMEEMLERISANAARLGSRISGATTSVDDETRRKLGALGYVQ